MLCEWRKKQVWESRATRSNNKFQASYTEPEGWGRSLTVIRHRYFENVKAKSASRAYDAKARPGNVGYGSLVTAAKPTTLPVDSLLAYYPVKKGRDCLEQFSIGLMRIAWILVEDQPLNALQI